MAGGGSPPRSIGGSVTRRIRGKPRTRPASTGRGRTVDAHTERATSHQSDRRPLRPARSTAARSAVRPALAGESAAAWEV